MKGSSLLCGVVKWRLALGGANIHKAECQRCLSRHCTMELTHQVCKPGRDM